MGGAIVGGLVGRVVGPVVVIGGADVKHKFPRHG